MWAFSVACIMFELAVVASTGTRSVQQGLSMGLAADRSQPFPDGGDVRSWCLQSAGSSRPYVGQVFALKHSSNQHELAVNT